MKTCETCKHWDAEGDRYGGVDGIKQCNAVPMFWDSTRWSDDYEHRAIKEAVTATAFAQDGSDYRATLYTMARHGCTMHELKDLHTSA